MREVTMLCDCGLVFADKMLRGTYKGSNIYVWIHVGETEVM